MKKIVFTKFKDNSFVVSNGNLYTNVSTEAELIATLYWFYDIKKLDTEFALHMLEKREHDMVEISPRGILLNTSKVNYNDMWNDDE